MFKNNSYSLNERKIMSVKGVRVREHMRNAETGGTDSSNRQPLEK